MKTEPSEIVFQSSAPIAPGKPYEMLVGTKTLFRCEELIVKTTKGFSIYGLWVLGENLLFGISSGDAIPAVVFAEEATPEARQLSGKVVHPWPADGVTLTIANDSDEPLVFEAVLKGKAMINAPAGIPSRGPISEGMKGDNG